jgi:uncharacterized protein
MSQFVRTIKPLESKSFFLFGARGVGKSTFIRSFIEGKRALVIDLLVPELEDRYAQDPGALLQEVSASTAKLEWIVIDEVQKCPRLLDVVQKIMVEQKVKFILSGSSARRLKQKGVNLLAGRALDEKLFPLTYIELDKKFDLNEVLENGSLPEVCNSVSKEEAVQFLKSYSLNYVTTEIQAEQWVKKLPPFRKFLQIAAQMNGKILNYTKIAKDVGVDPNSIQSYFEIIEDTLLGFRLPGYHRSVRKQQRVAPKFYLFDTGVKRALERTLDVPLKPQTSAYGAAFEHFVILEILRSLVYSKRDFELSYLLTKDDAEIDLIIERPAFSPVLVEIKSSTRVDVSDARHLIKFRNEFDDPRLFLLSNDKIEKDLDGVTACHWAQGITLIIEDKGR